VKLCANSVNSVVKKLIIRLLILKIKDVYRD